MNLRAYFKKMREVEATIPEAIVRVVSLAGDDGSIDGIITEVTRETAAKLIVEQRSRLATPEEVDNHVASQDEARRKIREELASQRLHVTILSDSQVESIRRNNRTKE